MRNLGIVVMIVGILIVILSLAGVMGAQHTRTGVFAAIVLIAAGLILYRRQPSRQ